MCIGRAVLGTRAGISTGPWIRYKMLCKAQALQDWHSRGCRALAELYGCPRWRDAEQGRAELLRARKSRRLQVKTETHRGARSRKRFASVALLLQATTLLSHHLHPPKPLISLLSFPLGRIFCDTSIVNRAH